MCMLCVIPPNIIPSIDKLENSALNNPHGFGFAIAVPSEQRIICERTMDADESINRFLALRTQYPEGYAIWHARYATHGAKNVNNCHPFVVGGDQRTYLAHNGVLDVSIPHADDRSDTRVFAEELLPAVGGVTALDNDWVFDMFEDYTAGSKVAVLTVDPAAKHPLYLLNSKAGWEDASGVWWSNHTCYLDSWSTSYRKPYASYLDDEDNWWSKQDAKEKKLGVESYVCPNEKCGAILDIAELEQGDGVCLFCGYCMDCEQGYDSCMCYIAPSRKSTDAWSSL